MRAALINAIVRDGGTGSDKARTTPQAPDRSVCADTPPDNSRDFTPHRRRYVTRQQAMEASIAPLRARLRTTLAARSPAMARLAAMDAVMEQLLGAREHHLLASVPGLLEKHFERLAPADGPGSADGATHDNVQVPDPTGEWLVAFNQDMQAVLTAELDIRMQPVEGLLAALRSEQPGSP
ncbi:hypothetical protein BH11PSE8_BH11PSE8_32570 [soil metagenome]